MGPLHRSWPLHLAVPDAQAVPAEGGRGVGLLRGARSFSVVIRGISRGWLACIVLGHLVVSADMSAKKKSSPPPPQPVAQKVRRSPLIPLSVIWKVIKAEADTAAELDFGLRVCMEICSDRNESPIGVSALLDVIHDQRGSDNFGD